MRTTIIIEITDTGETFAGSPTQILEQLMKSAWMAENNVRDYMKGVAHRVYMLNGSTISTETPEQFINDLENSELITKVTPN